MDITVTHILLAILLTPLAAAALIACFCRQRGLLASLVSVASAGVQMGLCLYLFYKVLPGTAAVPEVNWNWLRFGNFSLDLGYSLTSQTSLMLLVVTFVGFWIHVFAMGYMREDENRGRFFGGMSIFMFSMTGIVLSNNLFMMFIFWELVGFSSYMLIGHYLTKPSAAAAAKKAFIVNRVGDFGFLLGIILCYWLFGTTNFSVMLSKITNVSLANFEMLQVAALLLFCGVLGKSAQMPLHVWLPDAMEGPTPISALIHAATMVAAGVYLLGKLAFLYSVAQYTVIDGQNVMTGVPYAANVVAAVGVTTAVYAAFCALGVNDIKKILAYSTLSQLGYMVAAFGIGCTLTTSFNDPRIMGVMVRPELHAAYGTAASMFHLTTHAFFKALLFLGAGSVIYACHHEQDIFKMGGLWKKMPITTLTFLVGVLAISGIPYLSGFYSKDNILAVAYVGSPVAFGLLVMTAFLTAFYMMRLFFIAFLGSPKSHSSEHARENGVIMVLPLIVLSVLAVIGGFYWLYPKMARSLFEKHMLPHDLMASVFEGLPVKATHMDFVMAVSIACGVCGLFGGWMIYRRGPKEDMLNKKAPSIYKFLSKKLWFDEIYNYYVAKIQDRFASLLGFLDMLLIGGLMVRGIAGIAAACSMSLRLLHVGRVTAYVYWFAFGLLVYWALASGWLK